MTERTRREVRLGIVVTHPVQHFVSLYRALAALPVIKLRAFYASRMGLEPYFDAEMNRTLAWKMDLLSGYDHRFLDDIAAPGADDPQAASPAAIAAAFADFAPDAVIVYGYSLPLARDAARIARKAGAKLLMIADSELRQFRSWPRRLLKRIVLPLIYRRIDAFLTVGDENEAYYRHYGVSPRKLFRTPFPIDKAAFRAARDRRSEHRAALRTRLGLPADALVALFVGKLSQRKRPGDLLDAAVLVNHGGNRISAVFAGDGVLRAELQSDAVRRSADAHFLGFINVDELPSIYAGSDLIVHPSQSDPHPLICSEAACTGLPMILSNRVGAEGRSDIAQRNVNAVVYPVGDREALAEALNKLANNLALLKKMGQESHRIFDLLDIRRSIAGVVEALAFIGFPITDERSSSGAAAR